MIVPERGPGVACLEAIMAVRKNASMGFVDAVLDGLGGTRSATLLERLDAATPWETLAAPIRALPEYNNHGAGHPPWCPVLMLKGLTLSKWFNLSDKGLEEGGWPELGDG